MRNRALFEQRHFTLWFGLGLQPLVIGALLIAFAEQERAAASRKERHLDALAR